MATWADVKANALKLGILLTDEDVGNVPLLATDAYGNVILGANGFAQVVVRTGNGADGIAGTNDDTTVLVEGTAGGLDLARCRWRLAERARRHRPRLPERHLACPSRSTRTTSPATAAPTRTSR